MKHTPGPWVVESDSGIHPPGKRRRPVTILMVVAERGGMPGLIVNQGPVEPRDYANAHLIAAAPDLLEALKALVAACDDIDEGYPANAIAAAEAAIAKAEGK